MVVRERESYSGFFQTISPPSSHRLHRRCRIGEFFGKRIFLKQSTVLSGVFESGGPALNTDGGGLSSNHPGMRGIFLLIEAARQLRGESTAQVKGAQLAVAHGNGGMLGSRHSAGTVILGRD